MVDMEHRAMNVSAKAAGGKVHLSVTDVAAEIRLSPVLSAGEAREVAHLLYTCATAVDPETRQAEPGSTVGLIRDGDGVALTIAEGLVRHRLPLTILQASLVVEYLTDRLETIVRDEMDD